MLLTSAAWSSSRHPDFRQNNPAIAHISERVSGSKGILNRLARVGNAPTAAGASRVRRNDALVFEHKRQAERVQPALAQETPQTGSGMHGPRHMDAIGVGVGA